MTIRPLQARPFAMSTLMWLSRADRLGLAMMRVAIAVVFIWIGGMKFAAYEADSITPFVANSPVLSFFYQQPSQYSSHLTREGELVPAQREWQRQNGTYAFSKGLGTVEISIGLLVLAGFVSTPLGALGALLSFFTSFVTLSFLFTTPEAWVPELGDAEYGFPFLSGAGRLVLKDVMLFAGGFLLIVGSARSLLQESRGPAPATASVVLAPGQPSPAVTTFTDRTGPYSHLVVGDKVSGSDH